MMTWHSSPLQRTRTAQSEWQETSMWIRLNLSSAYRCSIDFEEKRSNIENHAKAKQIINRSGVTSCVSPARAQTAPRRHLQIARARKIVDKPSTTTSHRSRSLSPSPPPPREYTTHMNDDHAPTHKRYRTDVEFDLARRRRARRERRRRRRRPPEAVARDLPSDRRRDERRPIVWVMFVRWNECYRTRHKTLSSLFPHSEIPAAIVCLVVRQRAPVQRAHARAVLRL